MADQDKQTDSRDSSRQDQPKSRRITLADVAKEAGVSKGTVSRVLNKRETPVRIGKVTQKRVWEIAEKLDYYPYAAARALGLQRTQTIALVVPAAPSVEHEFHRFSHLKISEVLSGIDSITTAQGYSLVLQIAKGDPFADPRHLPAWKNGAVDGILWYSLAVSDRLGELPVPVVAINSTATGVPVSTVNADNYGGSCAMTKHLIRLGHRRIAHIAGPADSWNALERKRGYLDVMMEAGLQPILENGDAFEASGASATINLLALENRPTAIFAGGDIMALGVLAELRRRGIAIPDDIAVVGSDGIEFCRHTSPRLTSLALMMFETARTATTLLLELCREGRKETVHLQTDVRIVVSQSCGYRRYFPDCPSEVSVKEVQTLPYPG